MVDITRLNKSSFSAEESGQDALENTFTQKHKELSVLLLEMKEAQEEIAFKMQSRQKGRRWTLSLDQKEMKQIESEGIPPVKMTVLLEDTGQHFPPMPDKENSLTTTEKEEQMSPILQRPSEEISLNYNRSELNQPSRTQ